MCPLPVFVPSRKLKKKTELFFFLILLDNRCCGIIVNTCGGSKVIAGNKTPTPGHNNNVR